VASFGQTLLMLTEALTVYHQVNDVLPVI